MWEENLSYALTQVLHNFGAVALLGAAVGAFWPVSRPEYERALGWLIVGAWGLQIASGGLFGLISLYFYGETPDLSDVAIVALGVKVTAAITGFLLAIYLVVKGGEWARARVRRSFVMLAALGAVALTAAAFLRWFS